MYLLASHIPVYSHGEAYLVADGWYRDLVLARDWLAAPFGGRMTLVAPSRPVAPDCGRLERVGPEVGIEVVAGMDDRCRARTFWLSERKRWSAAVAPLLQEAVILHTAITDLYRPVQQLAFEAAVRAGVPTVLVGPDMDPHEVLRAGGGAPARRAWVKLYLAAFDRVYRHELRLADLALLKEGAVHERYARFAANPRAFCHTMYRSEHVVSADALDARLATLEAARPLRLVYCGRMEARKGLHVTLDVLARAGAAGARAELEIVGHGPEEGRLREQAERLRLGDRVRFAGQLPYGPELLQRLAQCDLLVFTPVEEDTPRMLYDGYAAGLPVLATEIPFVRLRAGADRAAVTFPVGDVAAGAEALVALDRDRSRLRALSIRARSAGLEHSTDNWYRRRRDWTVEAVERRRARDRSRRATMSG